MHSEVTNNAFCAPARKMTLPASAGWPVRGAVRGRDRLAQVLPSGRRRVMRVAAAQSLDGPFQYRRRRLEIRIADAQQDHIFAALLGHARGVVNDPGIRAVARDSLDQRMNIAFFPLPTGWQ